MKQVLKDVSDGILNEVKVFAYMRLLYIITKIHLMTVKYNIYSMFLCDVTASMLLPQNEIILISFFCKDTSLEVNFLIVLIPRNRVKTPYNAINYYHGNKIIAFFTFSE